MKASIFITLLYALSITQTIYSQNSVIAGPLYANEQSKSIVEKMIEAHGGLKKWRQAPAISYDNIFFNPYAKEGDDPWWISHEVVEQGNRRVYQYWPIYNSTLVNDGEKVWTTNWAYGNPPNFMQQFFYYFLNLPWLTQDKNIKLSASGSGNLPGIDKDLITIEMGFTETPTIGKTEYDKYILFIDPDTYLLRGYHYYNGFGRMLDLMGVPKGQKLFGPMVRIHDVFTKVEGIIFPVRFHTTNLEGIPTYGHHVVLNYSLQEGIDESKLKMPPDAVVDNSSDKREE